MLLSGEAIKQKQLIENACDKGYRGASYDLHIGKIVDSQAKEQSTYDHCCPN